VLALRWFTPVMVESGPTHALSPLAERGDQDLLQQATALQVEAREVLAELDLERTMADFGPPLFAGSFVSGLMAWRDLDIMFFEGGALSPSRVLSGLARLVLVPGIIGFDYVDERGNRSPTGEVRDERYHVAATYVRSSGTWRLDFTFWLRDPHQSVTAWHEHLSSSLTDEQRTTILRIKDVWCRRPEYPDDVSGSEIYTAVLDHGVDTPEQFATWLTSDPRT
jgi:hypothetical protein